jgi:adenylate kinase family enzyme
MTIPVPKSAGQQPSSARPIVFLLGPSGSGKSTLGKYIATDLNFLHLEIDRYPHDGIDLEELREAWNAFIVRGSSDLLAQTVRDRADAQGKAGAVLTFPSRLVLSAGLITAAELSGITTIILYGSGADCLESFLAREEATGRNLGAGHWILNNAGEYAQVSKPEYKRYREITFTTDGRRPRTDLIDAVRRRIRN